jgi:hypothetical protein
MTGCACLHAAVADRLGRLGDVAEAGSQVGDGQIRHSEDRFAPGAARSLLPAQIQRPDLEALLGEEALHGYAVGVIPEDEGVHAVAGHDREGTELLPEMLARDHALELEIPTATVRDVVDSRVHGAVPEAGSLRAK